MNNKEIFMKMSEAQLLGWIDRDFQEVLNAELKIVDDWIKNKKCRCAKHPNIQLKKFSLSCQHLKNEIEKKIKEKNKKISLKCNALNLRSLRYSKRFSQSLHTFQV